MNKEAQEKIRRRLDSVLMWGHNSTEYDYGKDKQDALNYHLKELGRELEELGYRKLPKDTEPPLVSVAMEDVSRAVANELIEAQREADIAHYEGL